MLKLPSPQALRGSTRFGQARKTTDECLGANKCSPSADHIYRSDHSVHPLIILLVAGLLGHSRNAHVDVPGKIGRVTADGPALYEGRRCKQSQGWRGCHFMKRRAPRARLLRARTDRPRAQPERRGGAPGERQKGGAVARWRGQGGGQEFSCDSLV